MGMSILFSAGNQLCADIVSDKVKGMAEIVTRNVPPVRVI